MPLLNPPEILPEAMRYLLRVLQALGGTLQRDGLAGYVAPPGLGSVLGRGGDNGDKIAKDSIAALKALGLVTVIGTGGDSTVELVADDTDWIRADLSAASRRLLKSIVAETQLDGTLEQTSVGADLLLGAAVVIVGEGSEGTAPCHAGSLKDVGDLQMSQFNEADRVLRSETWQSLKRWLTFLGLARRDLHDPNRLLPDPTAAIERHLSGLGPGLHRAADFISGVGSALPMLDGGAAFALANSTVARPVREQHVSRALSLSLLVLDRKRRLTLESGHDAEVWRLSGAGDRTFTHLTVGAAP